MLLWLDVVLLVGLLALEVPHAARLPLHEWGGVAFAALAILHMFVNWRWIVGTLARIRRPGVIRSRVNAALNGLLFVLMTWTIYSGLVISEIVLPSLGLSGSDLRAWRSSTIPRRGS